MGIVVLFFVLGLVTFAVALGAAQDDDMVGFAIGLWFIGFLFFSVSLFENYKYGLHNLGYPVTDIEQGQYKVVFVYEAGDNVSLGIQTTDDKKQDHLMYYQFPKNAFVGQITSNITELVVVKSGSFKKLELK